MRKLKKSVIISIKSKLTDLLAAEDPSAEDLTDMLEEISDETGEESLNMDELVNRVFEKAGELNTDTIELSVAGMLTDNGERVELLYDDTDDSGMAGSHTKVLFDKAQPRLVTMVRTGENSTSLVFNAVDRRQRCMYNAGPLPPFEICVITRGIVNTLTDEGGMLILDYVIEFRGVKTEYSHVEINVTCVDDRNVFTDTTCREYELP